MEWNKRTTARTQELFHRIGAGERIVDGCPVQTIRDVHEDGTDTMIGDISICRESTDRAWVPSDNETKAVGDPTIVWTIGCRCFSLLETSKVKPADSPQFTSRPVTIGGVS